MFLMQKNMYLASKYQVFHKKFDKCIRKVPRTYKETKPPAKKSSRLHEEYSDDHSS